MVVVKMRQVFSDDMELKFIEVWHKLLADRQGTMTLQAEKVEKVVNVLNDYAKEIGHDLLNAKQIKNKIDGMKKKAKSAYNCKIHLPCTFLSQKLRWVTGVGCSDQNKRGLRNKALLGTGSERARRRSDFRLCLGLFLGHNKSVKFSSMTEHPKGKYRMTVRVLLSEKK